MSKRRHVCLLKSLRYALKGIIYVVNNERNMRIHTVVIVYVFVFSFFFTLSQIDYAVLFICFALVMFAEIMNTVSERLADIVASSYKPIVQIVKDIAAGSVLICALFSLVIAACLFLEPKAFYRMFVFFTSQIWPILVLVFTTILSLCYIIWSPVEIQAKLHKTFKRNKYKN